MSLLTAGTLFAQPQPSSSNVRKPAGINLSLWKRMSTQPNDSIGSTLFNIGLFSSMNNLTGLSINAVGSTTRHDAYGLQLSGISNMTKASMKGIQLAGITNINGDHTQGVSVSGLVGIYGDQSCGILVSGLGNILGNTNKGITMAGLLNFAGNDVTGMHIAGMANIAGENYKGIALSGLINVAGGTAKGCQLSSIGNITAGNMQGLQMAVIGNVTGEELEGIQIGLLNRVKKGTGLQFGIFNYYEENFNGIQLGLVNANPQTRVQLMLYGGNETKLNIGARFKNKRFYTILGTGGPYLTFSDKFSASVFYRAGMELPLYKSLFISGDLGYQHIETFQNKNYGFPSRLYSLQTRINLEYRLNKKMGLFITGGYGWDRPYTESRNYDKGLIAEGGIILFNY